MKNVILISAFVAATLLNCVGQLQNMVADEDVILKSAKKVTVFIELGPPAAARYLPDFARAKKQATEKLTKAKLHGRG